jgi:GntR family transcriptional regulator
MTTQRHRPGVALQRDSAIPLYAQIAQALEHEIAQGRLAPSTRLPSESELMQRFGVSRITVRGAIASLAKAGVVEARQGKGTFVAGRIVRHGLDQLTSFYDAMRSQGLRPERELIEFRVATSDECNGTPFAALSPLPMLLRRLYTLDGKPIAFVQGLLLHQAGRLSQRTAAEQGIYELLASLVLDVERADIGIRACAPRADISRALGLPPRRQVLVMERSSFGAGDRLLEHCVFFITPEAYEFRLSVVGPVTIGSGFRRLDARPDASARSAASAD